MLIPYLEKTCSHLQLSGMQRELVIFDQFKTQTITNFLSTLARNNISVVEMPANCTDQLQPLDLSVNKPMKDHLKSCFHGWYAAGIRKWTLTGINDKRIN